MIRHPLIAALLVVAVSAAACSDNPAGLPADELALAQQAQRIAQTEAATDGGLTYEGLVRRLFEALHATDDPEARACLAEARALHQQAREAYAAGHRERGRELAHQAFLKVLCAIVEVFPNAPERTGLAADQAIVRIERFLGERDAPRIRRLLAHVKELRAAADRALAAGEKVQALALNLRSLQILHGLVTHLGERHEHDRVADAEMEGVSY